MSCAFWGKLLLRAQHPFAGRRVGITGSSTSTLGSGVIAAPPDVGSPSIVDNAAKGKFPRIESSEPLSFFVKYILSATGEKEKII